MFKLKLMSQIDHKSNKSLNISTKTMLNIYNKASF